MTDEEILKKVMVKSFKNGFCPNRTIFYEDEIKNKTYYRFIFSHSFAKAFWGEENGSPCWHSLKKNKECEEGWHPDPTRPVNEGYYPQWKFRLEQMVLEENPIKYLARFLE